MLYNFLLAWCFSRIFQNFFDFRLLLRTNYGTFTAHFHCSDGRRDEPRTPMRMCRGGHFQTSFFFFFGAGWGFLFLVFFGFFGYTGCYRQMCTILFHKIYELDFWPLKVTYMKWCGFSQMGYHHNCTSTRPGIKPKTTPYTKVSLTCSSTQDVQFLNLCCAVLKKELCGCKSNRCEKI